MGIGIGTIGSIASVAAGALGLDLSGLTNPFGAPSAGEWNLTQGAFKRNDTGKVTVFFYETRKGDSATSRTALEQATDSVGRRLAIYEYPYRDGQRVKDLGRKGEKFSFNIQFFGSNYQDKLKEFIADIGGTRSAGVLTHPVRGLVPAKFESAEFVHRHDQSSSVTIRATFVEDNQDSLTTVNDAASSPNSALRSALAALTAAQATIGNGIFAVSASLLLPAAIKNAMKARFDSITGQISRLLGQLAATFSSDSQTQALAAQASGLSNGVAGLTSGTQSSGSGTQSTLPPVFQVGFSDTDQASINALSSSFVNANQITTQQAVFNANQARTAITAALAEIRLYMGNQGADLDLEYRKLALQVQAATEAAISSSGSKVKLYVTPFDMSLRVAAFLNGLPPERQNDLESLNPYLGSVNLVPRGTQITVPAS